MQVMRASPYSMIAHSEAVCQCSSRTPPAVRRMSTPAKLFDTASSRCVTSRDHPPSCSRLCANENGYLNVCTPPASVGSGWFALGFCASSTEFVGPGSLRLLSEIVLGPAVSCAASFSAPNTLAAASVAELTPKNPRLVNASFAVSSPMSVALRRAPNSKLNPGSSGWQEIIVIKTPSAKPRAPSASPLTRPATSLYIRVTIRFPFARVLPGPRPQRVRSSLAMGRRDCLLMLHKLSGFTKLYVAPWRAGGPV